MKATDFLRNFLRVQLAPDRARAAEVRFLVAGVEVRVDMVRCEIGDPFVWTVELGNAPGTPGRVLTADEAAVAFQARSLAGEA